MPLHPKIQELIADFKSSSPKKFSEQSLQELRDAVMNLTYLCGESETIGHTTNHLIKGRLLCREYQPLAKADHPVILYFHPGGFVRGSIEAQDIACRMVCHTLQANVFSLEYRLAPEFPFPAQIEDGLLALHWLLERVEAQKITLMGESSGGNLAAVLAHKARDLRIHLKQQILIYPQLDYTRSYPSHQEFAKDYLLTEEALTFYASQYLPPGADLQHPDISPLFASYFKHLAPALILTAEYDPLRDEAEAYAMKLKQMGSVAIWQRFKGMTHGFFQMRQRVGDEALHFIAQHFMRD